MKVNVFWFRRDLRLEDNHALSSAVVTGLPVLPLFIFDTNITDDLPEDDPRINFIYQQLDSLNKELVRSGGSILVLKGDPVNIWEELISEFDINAVFINEDYEPYAIKRDSDIGLLLKNHNISLFRFKDQVIFEKDEILKNDGSPYTVFTPYKDKWLHTLKENFDRSLSSREIHRNNFFNPDKPFPKLQELGYSVSSIKARNYDLTVIRDYDRYRDYPSEDRTTYLSPHLRFGTVSIRRLVRIASEENLVFLNELIWREFFMQILYHFPQVVTSSFKPAYNNIPWRNNEKEFERWCSGETGYPVVDAGMRQLNETGYMHNRVRMITAGFLCKHLLIDWRWGEAYFAQKLLDYELSSNNGNWQWAAGTGCDAAPYFRIFNPDSQQQKFDRARKYVNKWIPGINGTDYPSRIIEHDIARRRAIETYSKNLIRG
jgi:deoxyribodipyrimidine photo-lyase